MGVLVKKGNLDTENCTQGGHRVKTEVMLPSAKEVPDVRREAWTSSF